MDNETVCSSCVSVYFGVFFYNYALVYRTRDGSYIFNPFVPRFFPTPKQGWANMKLHPFLHIKKSLTRWGVDA